MYLLGFSPVSMKKSSSPRWYTSVSGAADPPLNSSGAAQSGVRNEELYIVGLS